MATKNYQEVLYQIARVYDRCVWSVLNEDEKKVVDLLMEGEVMRRNPGTGVLYADDPQKQFNIGPPINLEEFFWCKDAIVKLHETCLGDMVVDGAGPLRHRGEDLLEGKEKTDGP